MLICDGCKKQVYKIKRRGNSWLCRICDNFTDTIVTGLHNRFFMKHYGWTTEARIRMIENRILSPDDNYTVIDKRTGKESPNY